MLRVLFAIGLTVLLWATAARSAPVPAAGGLAISGVAACAMTGESPDGDSDQQWRNAHHAIAVVTESAWKSAPIHAGLGSTRIARIFENARYVSSPDPPAASSPTYLRHTPLLI